MSTRTRSFMGIATLALVACHADAKGEGTDGAPVAPVTEAAPSIAPSAAPGLQLPETLEHEGAGDVRFGVAVVKGDGLPTADDTLAHARAQTRFCFLRGLQEDPAMHGRLVLELNVTTVGTVSAVTVVSNGGLSDRVAQCVSRRMKSLQFVSPSGLGGVLTLPVDFVNAGAAVLDAGKSAGPAKGT